MENGFIAIKREVFSECKTIKNGIYFLDLLNQAYFASSDFVIPHRQTRIKLTRGQLFTTVRKLKKQWGLGQSSIDELLNTLNKEGFISIERLPLKAGYIITIVNYEACLHIDKNSNKQTGKNKDHAPSQVQPCTQIGASHAPSQVQPCTQNSNDNKDWIGLRRKNEEKKINHSQKSYHTNSSPESNPNPRQTGTDLTRPAGKETKPRYSMKYVPNSLSVSADRINLEFEDDNNIKHRRVYDLNSTQSIEILSREMRDVFDIAVPRSKLGSTDEIKSHFEFYSYKLSERYIDATLQKDTKFIEYLFKAKEIKSVPQKTSYFANYGVPKSQEEKERWIKEVEEEERTKSLLLSRK